MVSVRDWAKWISRGHASIPYLLLENYKKLNLSDVEMMLIIHLHAFISSGIDFPSIKQLEERMSCTPLELTRMLNRLCKEGFLEIKSRIDENQRMREQYSLQPLWEKLCRYLAIHGEDVSSATRSAGVWFSEPVQPDHHGHVFKSFEEELGRPLTPMECETISAWLDEDKMEPEVILLALKEAVMANKRSFRYIDKILLEWQRNGLSTAEEVQEHIFAFRKKQTAKLDKGKGSQPIQFPFYNWLER